MNISDFKQKVFYHLNIKLNVFHCFAAIYVIYALLGTVFFSLFPCKWLNPDLLLPDIEYLLGSFRFIDKISSCPVRRKLSMLYILAGVYVFTFVAPFFYFKGRVILLKGLNKKFNDDEKVQKKVSKKRRELIGVFIISIIGYWIVFTGFFLIGGTSDSSRSLAIYSDNFASMLYSFFIASFFPMAVILAMLSFDMAFISNIIYKVNDDEDDE